MRSIDPLRAGAAGYLGLMSLKAIAALRGASRAPAAREPSADELARVLVVQPILSGDPGLAEALGDNLLALAGARFCWLVDDDDAEARRVTALLADRLAQAPDSATRLEIVVCPTAPDGVNPKLAKLHRALATCTDDTVFLVLDDDTRLPRESLGALLTGLERATVATGLPGYLPGRTPWARLVEQFVDNNAAMTYLTAAPVTINGMTWAIRVADLRALGGFTPLLRHLTDDLAVATAVLQGGGRICQTASPQWISTAVDSPGGYTRLLHRWMLFANLLLRRQPPATVATIAGLHGLPPLLLWAVVVGALRQRRLVPVLALLGGRSLVLRGLQRRIHGRVLHRPVLSVLSELAQPAHLAHAAAQPTIRWRSRTYRVRADDDFTTVP